MTGNEKMSMEVKDKDMGEKKDRKFMLKKKKKVCAFCAKDAQAVSFKDEKVLRKYVSEVGKILPRRVTGTCQKHQRELVVAINRARHLAILPYATK